MANERRHPTVAHFLSDAKEYCQRKPNQLHAVGYHLESSKNNQVGKEKPLLVTKN